MTSVHSRTWTERSAAEKNHCKSLAFGNRKFVAVSEKGKSFRDYSSSSGGFPRLSSNLSNLSPNNLHSSGIKERGTDLVSRPTF